MANGPPAPAGLILAACCSAVFPDHGDLSQSLVGIGSSMPMAWGWLMWTASREHQRHLGQAAITAGNCRPERHLYLNPEILRLPKRMPVLEIARHLVCSKCGAIGDGFVHIRASMWSC